MSISNEGAARPSVTKPWHIELSIKILISHDAPVDRKMQTGKHRLRCPGRLSRKLNENHTASVDMRLHVRDIHARHTGLTTI